MWSSLLKLDSSVALGCLVVADVVVPFVVVDDAVGDAAAKGGALRSPAAGVGGAAAALVEDCPPTPSSSPCNGCKGSALSRFSRQTMHWSAIINCSIEWSEGVQDDEVLEKA